MDSSVVRIGVLSMTGAVMSGLLVTAAAALWELGSNGEHATNADNARTCLAALNEPMGRDFEVNLRSENVSPKIHYACQETVKKAMGTSPDSSVIHIDPYKIRHFAYDQEQEADFNIEPVSFLIGGIVVAVGAWKLSPVMMPQ